MEISGKPSEIDRKSCLVVGVACKEINSIVHPTNHLGGATYCSQIIDSTRTIVDWEAETDIATANKSRAKAKAS